MPFFRLISQSTVSVRHVDALHAVARSAGISYQCPVEHVLKTYIVHE